MKRFFSVKYGFVSISIVLGVLIAVTIACDDPDVAQSISDGRDRAGQALSEEQALTGAINTLRQEIEGTISCRMMNVDVTLASKLACKQA